MKSLFYTSMALILLVSCDLFDSRNNENEKDNPCQVISSELVPQIVKDSMSVRYPGITATQWLKKDSTGYCVNFTGSNAQDIVILFSNDGRFVSQEENINVEQTGQHSDNQSEEPGCHCEIESPRNN